MEQKNKRILPLLATVTLLLAGCQASQKVEEVAGDDEENEINIQTETVKIDLNKQYQTIESFGASGSWWSQDVGGWTEEEESGIEKREYIAQLLFDPQKGIGLSSYRYNLGAGSTAENSPRITDPWRRAESFEVSPSEYDWTKDKNAQWFLYAADEYNLQDIYFFVNSPIVRLTKNQAAYGDMVDGSSSNMEEENVPAFASYVYDVVEHFLEEGIPITHVSPINEPQWEWIEGQEGSHYEPEEMIATLKIFIEEKEKRKNLENVKISMPELGEWGNSSYPYFEALIEDEMLMSYFDTWEVHSYWSNEFAKQDFMDWLADKQLTPTLKMSEWTEMVNGKDNTMDSALNLANQVYEDLSLLDVTTWQYWIAVSKYDYRDGLIYVDPDSKEIEPTKRLWTLGHFSKFVRPGYTRIKAELDQPETQALAFAGKDEEGKEEVITVLINNDFVEHKIQTKGVDYSIQEAYLTDAEHNLSEYEVQNHTIMVPPQSIVTILLK